jgi:hypothetical protein
MPLEAPVTIARQPAIWRRFHQLDVLVAWR